MKKFLGVLAVAVLIVGSFFFGRASIAPEATFAGPEVAGPIHRTSEQFSQGAYFGATRQLFISNVGAMTSSGTLTLTGALSSTANITTTGALSGKETVATLATTTVITTASTDKTFYITAGGTFTLPTTASSSGMNYRFIIASAISADAIISSAGGASGDDIEGSLIVAGAVVDCTANDIITFVSDGEDVGDFVTLRSNGTKWFIQASNGLTASKITCTG